VCLGCTAVFAAMDVVYNAFLVFIAFCKLFLIYFYVLFFADISSTSSKSRASSFSLHISAEAVEAECRSSEAHLKHT
jgi:hypothetical protein